MHTIRPALMLCGTLAAVCCLSLGTAIGLADDSEAPEPQTVVTNLDNPTGLAVHPPTGHVFIASHPGIYRLIPGNPGRVYLEVTGFPTDIYGMGPKYEIGPLGLAFLTDDLLVVGDGSRPDEDELVRVYRIGPQPPNQPRPENDAVQTLGPIEISEKTNTGEGNFYGVAIGEKHVFITCNGDDRMCWIARAEIQGEKLGELELAISTKEATGVNAPVPAIFTPDKSELVVGQMGAINVPADSLLTFYDPDSGELKKMLRTGLNDITGLAYSPKTGNLYCTDFSWIDPSRGGLFRLTVDGDSIETEKILSLDKPTSLVFDKEGRLYITVIGTVAEEDDSFPGQVLMLEAGL